MHIADGVFSGPVLAAGAIAADCGTVVGLRQLVGFGGGMVLGVNAVIMAAPAVASHDQAFLDTICTRQAELRNGRLSESPASG